MAPPPPRHLLLPPVSAALDAWVADPDAGRAALVAAVRTLADRMGVEIGHLRIAAPPLPELDARSATSRQPTARSARLTGATRSGRFVWPATRTRRQSSRTASGSSSAMPGRGSARRGPNASSRRSTRRCAASAASSTSTASSRASPTASASWWDRATPPSGSSTATGRIERFITSGLSHEERERIGELPRGHGLLGLIIRENRTYRITDIATHPQRYGFPPNHPPMHSFLGMPIRTRDEVVGRLYLTNKIGAAEFSDDDARLVEMFALHAGIAIENARLYDQVGRLAIVDERDRISRDLHDSIIQAIYAQTLALDDVPDLVTEDPTEAARRVDEAIDALHAVIRDIRNFIFGLRPVLLEAGTFAAGLRQLATELHRNGGVTVEVDADESGTIELAADRDDGGAARHHARGTEQHRAPCIGLHGTRGGARPRRRPAPGDRGRRARFRRRGGVRAGAPWARQHARTEPCAGCRARRAQHAGTGHPYHRVASRREAHRWRGPMTDDPASARPLRILVVDDHEIVRQGLVALLDRREGFEVVAQAGTVAEAVAEARRFAPDLVVMDVRLPDGSGIEACRDIRAERPETRVVMLTSYPDEEAVLSAIIAGASGYLLKQVRGRDLVAALESVARGDSLLDPAVTEKVLQRVRTAATGGATDELADLTSQERKILLLVAEGKTNKEIAADVFLSDKTVKNYVSSILSKLNLQRRTQAAAFVAKHHLGDHSGN